MTENCVFDGPMGGDRKNFAKMREGNMFKYDDMLSRFDTIINNNNNNSKTTMFMVLSSWRSVCQSSPGSSDECRMAPSGRRPKTKPDDLGCESACTGCHSLHPPSPFIIATQPES